MAENLTDWETARFIFLETLATSANVSEACREASISRHTAYDRRKADPAFARAWDEALESATDALEREARRRAVEGTLEPVFYRGEECGQVRKYSDRLLEILLKAHRPAKYRENHHVEHDGELKIVVEFADTPLPEPETDRP